MISGEIDISVATLTMTTEREEVIDFVSPYFDQVYIWVYILFDFFIAVKALLSFHINIFSNFSCMFLNPNSFFQFEF